MVSRTDRLEPYVSSAESHGNKGEETYEQGKPYLCNPRHGDEKQNVEVGKRRRPTDRGPEPGIVADVPKSECPQENGASLLGFVGGQQGDTEQHDDRRGLA